MSAFWKFRCLLCDQTFEGPEKDSLKDILRDPFAVATAHADHVHGYTAFASYRRMTRQELAPGTYRWTFPDGVTWLEGKRDPE